MLELGSGNCRMSARCDYGNSILITNRNVRKAVRNVDRQNHVLLFAANGSLSLDPPAVHAGHNAECLQRNGGIIKKVDALARVFNVQQPVIYRLKKSEVQFRVADLYIGFPVCHFVASRIAGITLRVSRKLYADQGVAAERRWFLRMIS
jgi:hypothetical protein